MLITHNYPKVMLIEMSGISSLISHTLNALCRTSVFDIDVAYAIAIYTVKYQIDIRCIWMLHGNANMDKTDIEKMLKDKEQIPPEVVEHVVQHGAEVIRNIEQSVRELLDGYLTRHTWHIWAVHHFGQYSISLYDHGDYRVAEWARQQQHVNSIFAQNIDARILGAE